MLTDSNVPLRASYWHVGLVVADIESAMAELGATTGAAFLPVQERPDGDGTIRVSFTSAAPHIELIEGNPDGLWATAGGPRLDHLAYWSADFDADRARFEESGMVREAGGRSIWGGQWAYYRLVASGLRVELCDVAGREAFLERWGLEGGAGSADGDDPVDTANGTGVLPEAALLGIHQRASRAPEHGERKP